MAKFILFGVALAATKHGPKNPKHVNDLYGFLDAKDTPTLGVLSQGNFDGVHHLVPDHTSPVIFDIVDELLECTRNGTVDASLISGVPENDTGLVTFSSSIVSVRAMFTAEPADSLRLALDAAIVRALYDQADRTAAANNPPFEFLAVHTCKTDEVERFPFPDVVEGDRLSEAIARGSLRIAAVGPSDWAQDGDYTQDPPVGFWPEFYSAIEGHFREGTGVGFERVWGSSQDAFDRVLSGEADTTEPYFLIDSYYNDRARQHVFVPSCSTMGYDKTFIVKDYNLASEVEETRELKNKVSTLQKRLDELEKARFGNHASGVALAVVAAVALAVA